MRVRVPHETLKMANAQAQIRIYKIKMYICQCGKKFEKINSLNAHYSHCLIHRGGKEPINRFKGKENWNKGLTKETDNRVLENSKKIQGEKHPQWGKNLSQETKDLISASLKGKTGGFREGCNHWKGEYLFIGENKIWLDSSWEKLFALRCIEKNIEWIKNQGQWGFNYKIDVKTHKYFPDFYLPKYDLWVEIKGREDKTDLIKWENFPHKLEILKSKKEIELFFARFV